MTQWKREVRTRLGTMTPGETTSEEWEAYWSLATKKMKPWQAAGPDGVQAFWLKKFPTHTGILYDEIWKLVQDLTLQFPAWLVQGRTVMIPK